METVDWLQQWEQFAEGFRDGKAHIDLSRFGSKKVLQLHPGPGFGDLSHPTTNLMLKLLAPKVSGKTVLDIGCGSGILTLASLLLGAKSALGIDIDPEAIAHAQKNAALNNLQTHFSLDLPSTTFDIAFMNMITSEQQLVMQNPKRANLWITSGILATQRKEYLALTKAWGWNLIQEARKGEWLGMVFAQDH